MFRKESRKDLQNRFKSGNIPLNKGTKSLRTNQGVKIKLDDWRHELVSAEHETCAVRLLRPKVSERKEVERSAECVPDVPDRRCKTLQMHI